jgi:hypothetical protein
VCQHLKLPVHQQVVERLLELCDPNGDRQIDYVEFVNFLNWKDQLPTGFGKFQGGDSALSNESGDEKEYQDKILTEAKGSGIELDTDGDVSADVLKNQIDLDSEYATSSSVYGRGGDANTNAITGTH